jgi:hypothetical protein
VNGRINVTALTAWIVSRESAVGHGWETLLNGAMKKKLRAYGAHK